MITIEINFKMICEEGMPLLQGGKGGNFKDLIVLQKSGTINFATYSRAHNGFYAPQYKKYLNDVVGYANIIKVNNGLADEIEEYLKEYGE